MTDNKDCSGDERWRGKLFCVGPRGGHRRGDLWGDVAALAAELPNARGMMNLCEDRYLFTVSLLAAACRNQVCLLPPSRQPEVLSGILGDHPGSYVAFDTVAPTFASVAFCVTARPLPRSTSSATEPEGVMFTEAAVTAFTSGSTGCPKACSHGFETFALSAGMALDALHLRDELSIVVSTTSPQHMFGLETSVFWPLYSSLIQYPGRPFFPEDIRRTVQTAQLPCILATTPTHLSAVVRAGGLWSNLRAVVCSTSYLSPDLACAAEALCGAPVLELYGSTETLSIASRRTALERAWTPYPGVSLRDRERHGMTVLSATHLPRNLVLEDRLKITGDGRFLWLGRAGDVVKVGGKRGSMAELNGWLCRVDGVRDGCVFEYNDDFGESRLAAVVVGEVSKAAICAAMRPHVDEVFLPRRIHPVDAIPRNETGKLVKKEWNALLSALGYPIAAD